MSVIIDVFGREVLDSRGNPTVEVEGCARGRFVRSCGRSVGRVYGRVRGR